jgi:hypothetical protein
MSLTKVTFSEMSKTPKYSNEQLARTKSRSGGLTVWGGAVSLPSKDEYFSDTKYPTWNSKLESLDFRSAANFLGADFRRFTLTSKDSTKANKFFPGITERFNLDAHTYAKNPKSFLGRRRLIKNMGSRITDPLSVISITRGNKNWLVEVSTVEGATRLLVAKSLVFAGGAIGNAVLAHLVSGSQKFELGNHVSAKLGTFFLKKPRRILGLINNFDFSEGKFITITKTENHEELKWSLRFQGPEFIEDEGGDKNYFSKKLSAVKTIVQSFLRLYTSLDLRLMREDRLGPGGLTVRRVGPGEFECDVASLEMEESTINELLRQTTEFFESLEGLKGSGIKTKLLWSDAAHYFGTVPMNEAKTQVSVDEFYKINGLEEAYAVGSSSFARGGHGHPTLLSIAVAIDFSKLFIAGRKSKT